MSDINKTPLVQGRFVDPVTVSTHFHIHKGDTVADFGAGSGYFMEVLAQLVGDQGIVYVCEIQKELVEKLGNIARSKGLSQVRPLWADVEDVGGSKIEDEALDTVVMVNTFFQFEDRITAIQEVIRTLRTGGKFFLIDWSESFNGLGPQPDHIVSEQEVIDHFRLYFWPSLQLWPLSLLCSWVGIRQNKVRKIVLMVKKW